MRSCFTASQGKRILRGYQWALVLVMISFIVSVIVVLTSPDPEIAISPYETDDRYIVTKKWDPMEFAISPPNPSLLQKAQMRWWEFSQRWRKPQPSNHIFPASPIEFRSIHGLLNQCTEVDGIRYAISITLASGSVMFGHTNALDGASWVAAFKNALENTPSDWYDYEEHTTRRGKLVLITNEPGWVVVVPVDEVHLVDERSGNR